jgi:hypothetical protein
VNPKEAERGRRALANAVAVMAFLFVGFLLWSKFPSEPQFVKDTLQIMSMIEGDNHLSPVASIDILMVLVLLAFVIGSLTLVFLTRLFADFYAAVVSRILREAHDKIEVKDAMPPLRWFAMPVVAFIVSLACTAIYDHTAGSGKA